MAKKEKAPALAAQEASSETEGVGSGGTGKPAADPKTRGPKGVPESAKIELVQTTNPKREGSKARARYDLYKNGMTVAEALAVGITTSDMVYNAKHGFIKIEGYNPGEIIQPKPKAAPKPKAEKKAKAELTDEQKAAMAEAESSVKEESLA